VLKKVWGLGERMCRNDLIRRWMLFKYLIQSVISYGVELWGWEERAELEKIMLDYIRWIFRLDFSTPRYIMNRELGLEKLKIGWGMRAMRFEERIRNGGIDLTRECWKEKKEEGWKDTYGIERKRFYNRYGWRIEEGEEAGWELEQREKEMREKEKKKNREEEDIKIAEARYNKRYKKILAEEEVPKYLKRSILEKGLMGDRTRALIKLRCGNLEEWNKFWLEENKRMCKFCSRGKDNMEHYVEECKKIKEWFRGLGNNNKEIWDRIWSEDLDEEKGEVLVRLWKAKEKIEKGEVDTE